MRIWSQGAIHGAGLACLLLSGPAGAEEATLAVGRPIERTLDGGASHSYTLDLPEARLIDLVLDQRGIDVVLSFFGPDGERLAEVDAPVGAAGREHLVALAQSNGRHRVEVRSPSVSAKSGSYTLTLVELRAAGENDRVSAEAWGLVAAADRLSKEGTAAALHAALGKYQAAFRLFRRVRDRRGEGEAIGGFASVGHDLGAVKGARDLLLDSVKFRRAAGDAFGESVDLASLGTVSSLLGDPRAAVEYATQALELKRRIADRHGEGLVLTDLATYHADLGQRQEALELLRQALELQRTTGDDGGAGTTMSAIGALYFQMGDSGAARDHFARALPLLQSANDSRHVAATLNLLSQAEHRSGQLRQAARHLQQAMELTRKTADHRGLAAVLAELGSLWTTVGATDKALDVYRHCRDLRRMTGDVWGEARALTALASVHIARREWRQARECIDQALPLQRSAGDQEGEALSLAALARLEREQGALEAARGATEQALALLESLRRNIVSLALRASYMSARRDVFELYVDLLVRLDEATPGRGYAALALAASERARARSLLELLAEPPEIRSGVDPALMERERRLRQLTGSTLQRRMLLLAGKDSAAQALELRHELGDLIRDLESVEAEIRSRSPRYAALTQPQPLGAEAIQAQLDADTLLLVYTLGEQRSFAWAVTRDSVSVRALPRRSVIEAAARRAYASLATPSAGEPAEPPEALRALGRMILGPWASALGRQRIAVVSDGALHYVPFAALPTPGNEHLPLLAEHELVSLPSASVLALLRQERRTATPPSKTLFVLGDPVFSTDDARVHAGRAPVTPRPGVPAGGRRGLDAALRVDRSRDGPLARLPFTRREARAILDLVPATQREQALGFEATRAAVEGEKLSRFRFVHFATHGFLNSEHPELSGIVLSLVDAEGRPQQGFLSMNDIFNLSLAADLVVLSGCRTALGRAIDGEGLIGLVRAFMYAGADRVVASLWKVDDAATAELMRRFYQRLLGPGQATPAAALRDAQLSLWHQKRWNAAYYWAAFTLQGDWN